MSIPPSYASVSVEKIYQPDFVELELEIPWGDGEKTLKDALHDIILWPKRYIVIIFENDGSPRDPLEPGRHRQYLLVSLYNRLWGRHRHYLLAHILCKNNKIIRVKRAPAITMMTSPQFTSTTIGHKATKVSSAIFQVGAITK
jgi:hypothetical protein